METKTSKPVAVWTPTGGRSLYGDQPSGDLRETYHGRLVACTITLESAQRLYPEFDVQEAKS